MEREIQLSVSYPDGSNKVFTFTSDEEIKLGRDTEQNKNDLPLNEKGVSRNHAKIIYQADRFWLVDSSTYGTFVKEEKINKIVLTDGLEFRIDRFKIKVSIIAMPEEEEEEEEVTQLGVDESTQFKADESTNYQAEPIQSPSNNITLDAFIPSFFNHSHVAVKEIRNSQYPVQEIPYLTIGGGIGSFVWVDHLRVYGVAAHQIKALGLNARPYAKYQRLCRNSQIPNHEVLRSNSESCPDNIWGFPGYALREAWKGSGVSAIMRVFGEPSNAETYTPRAGDVFDSIDEEAKRIDWDQIYQFGKVTAIRKTDDNRYVVAYKKSAKDTSENRECLVIAKYVHLCTGYPGTRLLQDLQNYRQRTGDFKKVVNAYEKHDHIYEYLEEKGGIVVIRGRGIVASRILQRLYEARAKNKDIRVLHLMRSKKTKGSKYGSSQRAVLEHWEFQPFNWNKACWGGELRKVLENADEQKRSELMGIWGGTTTADRSDWIQIIKKGIEEGWYQIHFGGVDMVTLTPNNMLHTHLKSQTNVISNSQLIANYIIDCTGLESDVMENHLLKDFIEHHQLERNKVYKKDGNFQLKGIKVSNDFEIAAMRNGDARMYAAGSITLHGPYAPVDSFLGLQYSALRSVEHLLQLKAESIKNLGPLRSFSQWRKWMKNEKP